MSWIVNDGNVPAGKHGCRVPGGTGSFSFPGGPNPRSGAWPGREPQSGGTFSSKALIMMDAIDCLGCSDYTSYKQLHLGVILKTHLRICQAILTRKPEWSRREYHYFDLNAGPGLYRAITPL